MMPYLPAATPDVLTLELDDEVSDAVKAPESRPGGICAMVRTIDAAENVGEEVHLVALHIACGTMVSAR